MKILVCGNYGAGNLGDEMILEGILAMLKSQFPKAHTTILSGNPLQTAKKYHCQSLPHFPSGIRSHLKTLFTKNNPAEKALNDCDYFILGGGGLFGGPEYLGNLVWLAQAKEAMKANKKLIIYGQSVGEIGISLKEKVKDVFQKSVLITVRDHDSQRNIQKLGIKKDVFVIPDLAFRTLHKTTDIKTKRQVIFALRFMKNLSKDFLKQITNSIQWLINDDYEIKFMDFQSGQKSDHYLHQKIKEGVKNDLEIITPSNPAEALALFEESQYVIGMRLHSVISAIKTTTPFLAINYAPKMKGLLRDLQLSAHILEMNNLNILKKSFLDLQSKSPKVKTYLKNLNKKLYKDHLQFEKKLKMLF